MIRKYENKSIYKILTAVKILSAISFGLSVLGMVAFIMNKYYARPFAGIEFVEISFYICLLCVPLYLLIFAKSGAVNSPKTIEIDTKTINDFTTTLFAVLFPLFALICLACQGANGFFYFGYMLVPHLFYIPNILLICNCFFIRREWKKNPPAWYLKAKAEKETKAIAEKQKQDKSRCEELLNIVGKRFFVELFEKLRDWDELDILDEIRGQYGEETARRRISQSKEIFKRGLEETALQLICDCAENKIDAVTRERAETILEGIKKEKGETA